MPGCFTDDSLSRSISMIRLTWVWSRIQVLFTRSLSLISLFFLSSSSWNTRFPLHVYQLTNRFMKLNVDIFSISLNLCQKTTLNYAWVMKYYICLVRSHSKQNSSMSLYFSWEDGSISVQFSTAKWLSLVLKWRTNLFLCFNSYFIGPYRTS